MRLTGEENGALCARPLSDDHPEQLPFHLASHDRRLFRRRRQPAQVEDDDQRRRGGDKDGEDYDPSHGSTLVLLLRGLKLKTS